MYISLLNSPKKKYSYGPRPCLWPRPRRWPSFRLWLFFFHFALFALLLLVCSSFSFLPVAAECKQRVCISYAFPSVGLASCFHMLALRTKMLILKTHFAEMSNVNNNESKSTQCNGVQNCETASNPTQYPKSFPNYYKNTTSQLLQ